MLNKNDVVKSIFKAWRDVTEFIENTQDEENKYNFKPEYLITVKVAENILLYFFNNNISEQYSILLEEKTSMAMTRREEEVIEYSKSRVPRKFRSKKETKRKGRFDIVVYKKESFYTLDSYRTVCVIEVKNYYGYFKKIQEDINRIFEFTNKDVKNNSFEFGIMTFIIKPQKKDWESIYNGEISIIENYKENIVKDLNLKSKWDLDIEVISKRYSDPDYPILQYLYIVAIITIL